MDNHSFNNNGPNTQNHTNPHNYGTHSALSISHPSGISFVSSPHERLMMQHYYEENESRLEPNHLPPTPPHVQQALVNSQHRPYPPPTSHLQPHLHNYYNVPNSIIKTEQNVSVSFPPYNQHPHYPPNFMYPKPYMHSVQQIPYPPFYPLHPSAYHASAFSPSNAAASSSTSSPTITSIVSSTTTASNSSSLPPPPISPPAPSEAIQNALLTNENIKTPQVIYRNLFHTMHCKLLDAVEWEGARVYINENVGYSGNAKRFKKKPEKGEKALTLECAVLISNDQPAAQCLSCKDYFETQKYYKANPDCIGRIVLVKNNAPIRVENAQFKILIKMMCCCVHHTVEYFTFQLNLLDNNEENSTVVYSAKIPLNVKQWRKSNQKKEECLIILEKS